ncbi:hypothetical protein [Halobacteriovorax sp. DA5]|uniref:hypothetical protein n=1 Tax=Halobacteriovorax sp. DA5 TaxID=2067553 RepID=UPI000CD01EF0|nr:hypothetical protein [Halobacteriovorax sp. DA5]POB13863.1 hypothetical protein C0Z22_07325 [Halobacteriovorax sp. DA5]
MSVFNKKESTKQNQPLSQKEAVYNEVIAILTKNKIIQKSGESVDKQLTEKHIEEIQNELEKKFKAGSIFLKETTSNKEKLKNSKLMSKYTKGLINNWLRRDKRLNGTKLEK